MYKLSINHVCAKKGFQNILCFALLCKFVGYNQQKFIILQKVSLGGGILPSLGGHDEGLVFDGVKWQLGRNQLNKSS
jgi:hypothetical protein